MFFQRKDYTCGPASLRIALRCYGHITGEEPLTALCGSTEAEGTNEEGLKRAILASGFFYEELKTEDQLTFRRTITEVVQMCGSPVLLCVDRWLHWVCVIGALGDRLLIADPARYGYNQATNGLACVSGLKLTQRAWASRRTREGEPPLYALIVDNKKAVNED